MYSFFFSKVQMLSTGLALRFLKTLHLPSEELLQLDLCLTTTYFKNNKGFCRLERGCVLGSPVSLIVANLYIRLCKFEISALFRISFIGQGCLETRGI